MGKQAPAPHAMTTDRQGNPYYVCGDTVVPPSTADLYVDHKQFKPGELAAEYWHAMAILDTKAAAAIMRFDRQPDASKRGYL